MSLIVIDIQPEYKSYIPFLREFVAYINKTKQQITFLYNGYDTLGMVSETDYKWWLMENGVDEDVIDSATFYDKGYAFFRNCMDRGLDHEEIVGLVRLMYDRGVNDSRDLDEEFWDEYVAEFGSQDFREAVEKSEDCLYIPDLMDFLKPYNNITICGGGVNECLKEVEIGLDALGKKYKKLNQYIYKKGGQIEQKLLAPNGKPSNLTPEQYKLVRTPAFKKWFGDWENDPNNNMLVDENLEPMVWWHTGGDWTKLNNDGINGKGKLMFSPTKSSMAYGKDGKQITTRPFFIKSDFIYMLPYEDRDITSAYRWNKNKKNPIWFVNAYGGFVVVRQSNQIKLADGTNTTFDGSNPDIRYKQGANIKNKTMEKEIYCVVVVQFDNGVKRTTEVMPKQLATDWINKYGGKEQNCELFECTADGEVIRKLETAKMELGGGVEPIKNAKGEYALYPEKPNKKSMGLLLEYGGTMFTSEDMSAPTIGGEMASSMRGGGNVKQYENLSKQTAQVLNDSGNVSKSVPEIDIRFIDKTEFDGKGVKINNSQDANRVLRQIWDVQKMNVQEEMNILFTNKANVVVGYYRHSKGGIDGTIVDKELICGLAVKCLAKGVIIAHNHPSGNLTPSQSDISITNELNNALKLFNITLLDSIIITKEQYYSLKDENKFEFGGMMRTGGKVENPNEIKAKTYKEWLALMRKDNNEHNKNAHSDDVIPFWEWVSEMGAIYGFKPIKDASGDTIVVRTQDNPPNKAEVLAYIQVNKKHYADEDGDFDESSEEQLAEDVAEHFNISNSDAFDYIDEPKMKDGGNIESSVTHTNVQKFKNLSPEGYDFSKKKMTELARKRLGGYWLSTANMNEKKREMSDDKKNGKQVTNFDYEWLQKYSNVQYACFIYLKNNGFLKKPTKTKMRTGGSTALSDNGDNYLGLVFSTEEQYKKGKEFYGASSIYYADDFSDEFRTLFFKVEQGESLDTLEFEIESELQETDLDGWYFTDEQFKNGGFIKKENLNSANDYIKNNSLIFRFNGDAFQRGKKLSKSMAGYHRKVVREILTGVRKYKMGGFLKKKDNDDISQYYDMGFALGGGVPNQKQMDIITQKIGLSVDNADYLIKQSPKFAVWFADVIVKDEAKNYTIGSTANVNIDGFQGTIEIKTEKDAKEITLKRLNVTSSYIRVNYNYGIRQVLDWLMHPLTPKQNLRELSFAEAIEKAKQWHDELQALGGDVNFVENEENEIIKRYPLTEEGIEYYWVGIPKGFCDIESKRMGHCGRTGHGGLISLRSIKPYGKGYTINDSHVTIAYDEDDNLFYQVKGKKNQKPSEKYYPYIFDLIKTFASDIDSLFKGFGSEYESGEDYGFGDMTKEQIEELYKINKYIFNDFEGEALLYSLSITDKKPNSIITIITSAERVGELLNIKGGYEDKLIKNILDGDLSDWFGGNWSYHYDNYKDIFDALNKENEELVVKEIMRITNHSNKEILENGVLTYLAGNVNDFHEDLFDDITRALANASASADEHESYKHYKKEIEGALGELGIVEKLNYDGVKLKVDLSDQLTNKEISLYMKHTENNDLEDVFWEAVNEGKITLGDFSIDDRWSPYASNQAINDNFDINV